MAGKVGKLKGKRARFVEEYLLDLNASAAYLRAGYKSKNPDVLGHQLLSAPEISAAIQVMMAERSKRTEITADMVVRELAAIAFGAATDACTWGPGGVKLKSSEDLTGEQHAAIAEISETTTKDGGSLRLKRHDKVKALELLGKHLGMFRDVTPGEDLPMPVSVNIQVVDGRKS